MPLHRRHFIASALATATLPRLAAAQTPAASPVSGSGFASVEIDGRPLALSPDGTMIAGLTDNDEVGIWDATTLERIAISDPDTGTAAVAALLDPNTLVWAPDSSAVAFSLASMQLFRDSDIFTFDIESGTLANITGEPPEDEPAVELGVATPDAPLHVDLFPTWSPDGTRLAFSRSTYTGERDYGTDLCILPREGGEVETVATLSEDNPFLIGSTMIWGEDDTLLYGTQPISRDAAANGIFRAALDGTITPVSSGMLANATGAPTLASVNADATLASITALGNMALRFEESWPGTYFRVDLTSGIPTRFEDILGLPTDFDEAWDAGLLLDAPPEFVPGTSDLLYVTSGTDGSTLWQKQDDEEATAIATLPQRDEQAGLRLPRIDIGENGAVLILAWDGTFIGRAVR